MKEQLENLEKAIDVKKKLDESGMSTDELQMIANSLITSSSKMKISPIEHNSIIPASSEIQNIETDDESESE